MTQNAPLTDDVKSAAKEIANDAQAALHNKADAQVQSASGEAARRVENVANAAQAAGDQFDIGSLQARAAQQVADQIEGVAQHLRATDLNTLVHDTSEFARRNPLMFIGGAALLGVVATRFLKARDPQRVDVHSRSDDPWGDIETRGDRI